MGKEREGVGSWEGKGRKEEGGKGEGGRFDPHTLFFTLRRPGIQ